MGSSPARPWRSSLLVCAIGCLTLLAATGSAAGHGPHGAELTISAGSVSAGGGKLKGAVTVHNGGASISRRVFVTLIVALPGPDRLAGRTHLHGLAEGTSRTVSFEREVPAGLPIGRHQIWACVSRSSATPVPAERNGCRAVGSIHVPHLSPGPGPVQTEVPKTLSTVPSAPIPFENEAPFLRTDSQGNYWADVPASYDATHQTPTTLFVWLHGCGGESSGDIYTVSPEGRDWISIAVGGREGDCWDPNSDQSLVLTAIADVETHFNIDRHRVILGGYSSGGDLAYRLAFYNADQFAGVLAENTSPFRDTGSTESASLAAAAWKFHVVHLAHLQDMTYPIQGVREETDAMIAAGFPLQRIEVDGGHYDEPGEIENGHAVPGTDADLVNYLLPHIDDGWRSP